MNEQATAERGQGVDRVLFITVILLAAFGVVMVYSASAVTAARQFGNPSYFLVRQAIYALVGLAAMLVASRIDCRVWAKLVYPFLALSLLGVVVSLTRLGLTLNGAARWISLGSITVQPAEALKLSLVLWLSYSLAKKSAKIKTFSIGFLPHLLVPGIAILLCLLQPDFGTAVVLALLAFSLLFVAGAKLGYIMGAALLATPVAYLLVAGSEYRLKRLLTFLDPLSTRFGDGYQLSQSLFGFGAGGVTGVGLGDGMQKFLFLPEAHNDFIASIIAEELGMVGVLAVMLLIGIVVQRGVAIAFRARDEFSTYVALGISVLIGLQTLANLGVAMGLLPTKGLNLPFISFGGSALVMTLLAVGILLGISRQRGAGAAAIAAVAGDEAGLDGNHRRQPGEEGAGA
jgi:cell division protein FtsW